MLYRGRATDVLTHRPGCDICRYSAGEVSPAIVDGATHIGPWAYMCDHHFTEDGIGLGEGVGQVLLCGDALDIQLKREFRLEDE